MLLSTMEELKKVPTLNQNKVVDHEGRAYKTGDIDSKESFMKRTVNKKDETEREEFSDANSMSPQRMKRKDWSVIVPLNTHGNVPNNKKITPSPISLIANQKSVQQLSFQQLVQGCERPCLYNLPRQRFLSAPTAFHKINRVDKNEPNLNHFDLNQVSQLHCDDASANNLMVDAMPMAVYEEPGVRNNNGDSSSLSLHLKMETTSENVNSPMRVLQVWQRASGTTTDDFIPVSNSPFVESYHTPLANSDQFSKRIDRSKLLNLLSCNDESIITAPICQTPLDTSIQQNPLISSSKYSIASSSWTQPLFSPETFEDIARFDDEVSQAARGLLYDGKHVTISNVANNSRETSQGFKLTGEIIRAVKLSVAYENERRLLDTLEVTDKPCKCKNTHCLKLYCSCFQSGVLCDAALCICEGCKNKSMNEARTCAIKLALGRRMDAFDQRVRRKFTDRCSCKKSRCLRKYCECKAASRKCSNKCHCTDCGNESAAMKQKKHNKGSLHNEDNLAEV